MQPLELLAATYAIERANKLYGTKIPIPHGAVKHPNVYLVDKNIYSRLTAKMVKINGESLTLDDGRAKRSGNGGAWNLTVGGPTTKGRIHGFIHHAIDGVDLGKDPVPILTNILDTAMEALEEYSVLTAFITESSEKLRAQAAIIDELNGRIKLLSETKQ